ncbi:MAG: hypothetical protein AAB959_00305 [Patescibacteria group bacterium]
MKNTSLVDRILGKVGLQRKSTGTSVVAELPGESLPTGGLWTMGFGALGATLKALEERGVTPKHLKRIRSDIPYADHVALQILTMPQGAPIPTSAAMDIMTVPNYWGAANWMVLLGDTVFSRKEKNLEVIRFVPISERELWAVRHSHFLFLGLSHDADGTPITVRYWQRILPTLEKKRKISGIHPAFLKGKDDMPILTKEEIINQPFFSEKTLQLKWYLVRKDALPESRNHSFETQQQMVPSQEVVASPIEIITALILASINRRAAPLFQLRTSQCTCRCPQQLVVAVDGEEILLKADERMSDNTQNPDLGLATAWKFPE